MMEAAAKMSILVTGSSGFVGLNIVEHLLARGDDVIGVSDRPVPQIAALAFAELPGRLVQIVADVRNQHAMQRIMSEYGVKRVVHAAAVTSNTARERTEACHTVGVNMGGLTAVAGAAAAQGVERFVFVSSNAVFGGGVPDYALLDEDWPKAPGTIYALSKWTGEMILDLLGASTGLDWVAGRLAGVFGPWEYRTGIRDFMNPVFQANTLALAGRHAFLPRRGKSNWHFARDAASALVTLLDAPAHKHKVYNLGTPYVWSIADWCDRLAARFPAFEIHVGSGDGAPIDLYGDHDGGILSGDRFTAEFGPTGRFDLDAAFDHLMEWQDRHDHFGLRSAS